MEMTESYSGLTLMLSLMCLLLGYLVGIVHGYYQSERERRNRGKGKYKVL